MGPNSIHPCKVAPALGSSLVRVPYGGGEHEHQGQYDLLRASLPSFSLLITLILHIYTR